MQAIINIIGELKLNGQFKWIEAKTFFEYEKKVIKNLNKEFNDEQIKNLYYKINDNIDFKLELNLENINISINNSSDIEIMDEFNLDINLEEINSDIDFDEYENKDYNLNIIYKEVGKNLEDININEYQMKEVDYSKNNGKLDNLFLNIKAKKRKNDSCESFGSHKIKNKKKSESRKKKRNIH